MQGFPVPGTVDIVALVVVALGTWSGYRRGLSGELARATGVVGALVAGLYVHGPLGLWLTEHTRLAQASARTLAFAVSVAGSIGLLIVLRSLLGRIMRVEVEKAADKPGGAVAGFLGTSAMVAIFFLLMNMWPHPYLNRMFGERSMTGSLVLRATPALQKTLQSSDRTPGKDAAAWRE